MKLKLVVLYILLSANVIFSQSSSPYTRYGVGDLKYSFSPRMQGIGQLGVSILDNSNISTINPASWSVLNRTRIEFALGYNGVNISNGEKSFYTAETEIDGFTFGFPVSNLYGISIAAGLVPYSRISYKTVQSYTSNDTLISDYSMSYEGKGGLSRLFIGSSYKLPLDLSVGATLDYYFGNLNYLSIINFTSQDNYSAEYELSYRPTGFGSTLGLVSPNFNKYLKFEFLTDLRFGGSLSYFSEFDTDTILTTKSSLLVDTLSESTVKMKIPTRINLGLSFIIDRNYLFTFDYSTQNFSDFEFAGENKSMLRKVNKFSTGFEFIPSQQLGMTFWERVSWRMGLSYEQTPYYFNNVGINQYSFYGGCTVPLGVDNRIDFAVQYAIRGTIENNLLKENFIKFNVGISFGELWFIRYEK